jgi:predicted Zn-ribbon and HTH transcriptional regulator
MSPSTEALPSEAVKRWEVADIFREFGEAYMRENFVLHAERKVMHALTVCRTSYLGGHVEKCNKCGFEQHAYNSCRNRHCPKCQCLTKARWLENRKAELLPVPYFHNVFTLPHEVNPVALSNKKAIYSLLFKAVSETLLQFDRNNLGGTIGFTAILHTWDQRLLHHIHLHCVIPGGALSPEKTRWISSAGNYLFTVEALSMVFKGKFIEHLEKAYAKGELNLSGTLAKYATHEGFSALIGDLRAKDWVVFSKKPFAGPQQVIDYIGRYTHRVAISNNRLTTVDSGEFIKRFLVHVLPIGFTKIRHFGFLANKNKKENIQLCRKLIGDNTQHPEREKKTAPELMIELTGIDITRCPCCKEGTMITVMEMPYPSRRAYSYSDSSYKDSS